MMAFLIDYTQHDQRLRNVLASIGYTSSEEVYCEMLQLYFHHAVTGNPWQQPSGNDYYNARTLAKWGFLTMKTEPLITEEGTYHGQRVSFRYPKQLLK